MIARTLRAKNRIKDFVLYEVLHADDSPHRIALGIAIGMFVAFTPTIPIQMGLIFIISWMVGANKVVGVPMAWISNPATFVPIFFPQYVLGCYLLGIEPKQVEFDEVVTSEGGWMQQLIDVWELLYSIFWPLWIGSLLVSSVLGVGAYYVTRYIVVRYRHARALAAASTEKTA